MEEYTNIELVRFNRHKFNVFCEACKKHNISSRDAINEFMDKYIMDVFCMDASSVKIDTEETIEEY